MYKRQIHIDMNTGTGLPDEVYTMMLTDHKYQLRKDLFDLDALVFDGGQIRQAGIVMPDLSLIHISATSAPATNPPETSAPATSAPEEAAPAVEAGEASGAMEQ